MDQEISQNLDPAQKPLKPGYKYVTTNPNLYTLSPNEEARVIKEDNEKRRVLRLLQVREAQRLASQNILILNRKKRDKAVEQIGDELKQEWVDAQNLKIEKLDEKIENLDNGFGKGFDEVVEEAARVRYDERKKAELEANARLRGKVALKIRAEISEEVQKEVDGIENRRHEISEAEKERARLVANLPKQVVELTQHMDTEPKKAVLNRDLHGKSMVDTLFNIEEGMVDFEHETPKKALDAAIDEQIRIDNLDEEIEQGVIEKRVEAEVRGEHALDRVRAENDVHELEDLARKYNRQMAVKFGKEVGQIHPHWQRAPEYMQEDLKRMEQRKMETAFERIVPRDAFSRKIEDSFDGQKFEEASFSTNASDGVEIEKSKSALKRQNLPQKTIIEPVQHSFTRPDVDLNLSGTSDTTITETESQNLGETDFRPPLHSKSITELLKKISSERRDILQKTGPNPVQTFTDTSSLNLSTASTASSRKVAVMPEQSIDSSADTSGVTAELEKKIQEILAKSEDTLGSVAPGKSYEARVEDSPILSTTLDMSADTSTGNSTNTTTQFENILDQVRAQKQVHMNFISEIEQQRAKIQAEIDEIRLGNKKTHADFQGEQQIDSELHQLDIPLSELKSYSEPKTKTVLGNDSIVEDLPNLSHYVNQYLQPQISPGTQITQVTQESQTFQNIQNTQTSTTTLHQETQETQEIQETQETQETQKTQDSFLTPMSFPITETPIAPQRAESRSSSNHTKISSNNTKSTTNHSRKSWFERAADGVLGSSRNDDSPNLISDHLNLENQTSENILVETESSINFSNPISSIHRTNSSINSLSLSSGLTPRQYSSINLTGTGSNHSMNRQSMNERSMNGQSMNGQSMNEQSLNSSENSVNYRNLEPVRDLEAIPDENHENNERHIISQNTTGSTPQISDRTVSSGKSVSFRLMTPVTDHGSPQTGANLTEPADLTLPQSESFQQSHHESLSNLDFSPIREDYQGRLSQFDDTSAISLPPNMTMNETGQSDRSVQLENYLRRLMEEREDLEEFLHRDDK